MVYEHRLSSVATCSKATGVMIFGQRQSSYDVPLSYLGGERWVQGRVSVCRGWNNVRFRGWIVACGPEYESSVTSREMWDRGLYGRWGSPVFGCL